MKANKNSKVVKEAKKENQTDLQRPTAPPIEFKESFLDISTGQLVKSQPSPVAIALTPSTIGVYNNEDLLLPKDYFVWSIINLLCCNIVFGMTALVFSIQTRNYIKSNNFEEAKINSKRSFLFNFIGSILTVIIWILVIIFIYNILSLVSKLRNL